MRSTAKGTIFMIITLALVALFTMQSIAIANDNWKSTYQPQMTTTRTNTPIKIDGDLSDSGWRNAAIASNFTETYPDENVKPDVKTIAYLTYDDEYLYVSFIAWDNPDDIRATMTQRDNWGGNDAVGIMIDTYGEATMGYGFYVNPYGIQRDWFYSAIGGTQSSFDMIWKSAAQVTDSGFQVEMAIPFASMRFPKVDAQSWRINFDRDRPRENNYSYSWGADDRNESCWPCKWGTVNGIANVFPGKGMEILSSLVGDQSGQLAYDNRDGLAFLENDNPTGELSIGGKYSINSDMTAEAYINPDFSQIEADAAQMDVNTTISLFLPERRPFFQEGADLFRTNFNSFNTRTVWAPQYAAKFTGRTDQNSIAFMTAADEQSPYALPLEEGNVRFESDFGMSYVNVLRGQRSFKNGSRAGFMLTDRRFEGGGSGSIASFDGSLRISSTVSVIGQFVMSHTKEPDRPELTVVRDSLGRYISGEIEDVPFADGKHTAALDGESYTGNALITQLRRFGRDWYFVFDYNQVDPTYRTQTGYDPWNDQRNSYVNAGYTFYPNTTIFQRISPRIRVDARWNYAGYRKWMHSSVGLDTRLRVANTYISVNHRIGEEKWSGVMFDNLSTTSFYTFAQFSDAIGAELSASAGQGPATSAGELGDEYSLSGGLDLKPIDRLTIEPSLRLSSSNLVGTDYLLYSQLIARTRLQLQANRQLSIRLVVQYVNTEDQDGDHTKRWDLDPLITYRINSFSVFYVGSTHDYRERLGNLNDVKSMKWTTTTRKFFMKLQYLFQV